MFLPLVRSLTAVGLALGVSLFAGMTDTSAVAPNPQAVSAKNDVGQRVAEANNAFAFDLYAVLAADPDQKGKNLFFSPFSIEAALAMTAAGASGEALSELQKGLHLPQDEGMTDAGFGFLFDKINAPNLPPEKRGYQLSTANALFAQKGVDWSKAYIDRVAGKYGSGILDADFIRDFEKERQRINTWVEKETNDKIKQLLAPGVLSVETRMVLVNAIYFKGDWATAFDKQATLNAPFTRTDGTRVNAKLMHRTGRYAFHEDAQVGYKAIELPYKGEQVGMIVVLPDQVNGLPALEKKLTVEKFSALAKTLAQKSAPMTGARTDVEVFLPKFKAETSYLLQKPLETLGMRAMFSSGKRPLQRLTSSPNELFVSAVVHKGFVDVNEEGTEAAAATAVIVGVTSVAPPKPVFKADHPFLFAIVHKPTNTILFLGRVEDPTAK